jgi:acetamidase/formamidase
VAVHELPLERRTLHGHFSRDLEPVLEVEPGDSVRFAHAASTRARPGELDGDVGRSRGRSVRLAPFLGVLGMPPPEPGVHSTGPPRRWGGRAARIPVDGMVELMGRELGLERSDALAFASVVVDLRVTEVVNGVLGVHAVLRDDAFL